MKKHVFSRVPNHAMAAILFQKLNSEGYSRIVELQVGRLFLYKTVFLEEKLELTLVFHKFTCYEFVHS